MEASSDNSDIEVSKIVDELEDLDDDLFGDTFRKKKPRESQKKVAFQDLENNSLNDLLSDSNESHRTRTSSSAKGSRIEDLFGTGGKKNTDAEKTSTSIFKNDRPGELSVMRAADSTKVVPDRLKKSSLMEDLFGPKSRATSLKNIYDTSKNLATEESVSASMPNLSKNESKSSSTGFTLSSTRESRRGRPKSTVPDDPLGLLSQNDLPKAQGTTSAEEKSSELPEWLGGTKKSTSEAEKHENTRIEEDESVTKNYSSVKTNPEIIPNLFPDVSRLAETQLEQQSALVRLQQQEHELRTAALLSQQTEQLNSVVESQKNKLNEQERLFDTLVKSQVDRQAVLETQIKLQQARIDNYIQTLMRYSTSLPSTVRSEDVENIETDGSKVEVQSLIHNLEIERNNLEHLVEVLKEKHRQEIKILEDSQEMQLRFMHETMEQMELKLRRETEELENKYTKKIERLTNEKDEMEKDFKTLIDHLKTNHELAIKEIHNRHSDQLILIQKEYSETMGNISHAKDIERQTIDFIQTHKTDLEKIFERSQFIFDTFHKISDRIKNQDNELINKREKYIQQREEKLEAAQEELSNDRRNVDLERKQIESTVQKLQLDTTQLSGQLQKNLEIFYEREERLAMQEKTLMRERELLQEQTKWERDHLQSLKETWMAEQKHHIKLLTSEREALAAEKAKLEVLSSLKSNSDDLTKAELAAALATAREAAQEADRERLRWQEQNSRLQTDSRKLEAREKQLMQKAGELEELTQAALAKREEGLRSLKDAQRLEKQYKNQIENLQRQIKSLEERERQMAAEKLALARERLAFRASQGEKPEKDVANDTLKNKINESTYRTSSQLETHFKEVVDPELLLLKLNLDNRLDTSTKILTDFV